jgi:hypothetical protein
MVISPLYIWYRLSTGTSALSLAAAPLQLPIARAFARLRARRLEQQARAAVAYHAAVDPDPTHNATIVQLGPVADAGVDYYVKIAGDLGAKVCVFNAGVFECGL